MEWTFSANIVPEMTSNTAPSPYVASASNENSPAYRGFDHASTAITRWSAASTTGWLKIDLGAANAAKVRRYTLQDANEDDVDRNPKDWTLQGSNNDTDWTTIDTQTGIIFTNNEKKTFTCTDNGVTYRYYKIDITLNGGDAVVTSIGEMELMTATLPPKGGFSGFSPWIF